MHVKRKFGVLKSFTGKHLDSVLNVVHIVQSDTWGVLLCENKIWATDISRN
jgi:hypothetical protein